MKKPKAKILISLLHKTWLTKAIQFWTLDVSRERPMNPLIRLSVCPSDTNFSQDWIISAF